MTRPARPKIAFLQWHDAIGGAELFTAALVRELRKEDVDAGILLIGRQEERIDALAHEGVPVETLGHARGRTAVLGWRDLRDAAARIGREAVVLPGTSFLAPLLRWGGYQGRVAAIEHGTVLQIPTLGLAARLKREAEWRASAPAVDLHVAVSGAVADAVRARGSRNCVVIHNGVPLPPREPPLARLCPDEPIWCGMLGRLATGKGFDVAIRAIAELADLPRARLAIFGDGAARPALAALAQRLRLGERVEFRGWSRPDLAWPQVQVALAVPDRLVEGFGLSALEALAHGRPVIAARAGGLSEVVEDGISGQLIEPGDPAAIADAIRSYAADPSLYQAHAGAALARSRAFDIEDVSRRYADVLDRWPSRD